MIPRNKLKVNFSLKISTLTNTATTGSSAPKIAAGVEPILLMAKTRHNVETTVVKNAKTTKLKNKVIDGIANDSFPSRALIIKKPEVKSME